MKTVIMYNPLNIEQVAIATVYHYQQTNKRPDPEAIEVDTYELMAYSREHSFRPPACDNAIVIGVGLAPAHLNELAKSAGKVTIHSVSKYSTISKNSKHPNVLLLSVVDIHDLRFAVLPTMEPELHDVWSCLYKICEYQNFEVMSKEDLGVVNEAIKILDTATRTGKFDISNFGKKEQVEGVQVPKKFFAEYLQKVASVRAALANSLAFRYLGTAHNGILLLTANLSTELSFTAARQLSYAHDCFMLYQDLSDCRLWTVYNTNPYQSDAIAALLKPVDYWTDGRILYVKTAIPSVK